MMEPEMQVAIAREEVCRYLAACYYEPEAAFEEEGLFDSLVGAAQRLDEGLVPGARRLAEQFRTTPVETLLLDHTRLFLGPTEILAKPYGSVWLDEEKTLMGQSTMALLEIFGEADFEMNEEFKELPDHVAVELEFLYLLTFRENEAALAGDSDGMAQTRDIRERFLAGHLARWVPPFTDAVLAHAQTPFYRELAALTRLFLAMELARGR